MEATLVKLAYKQVIDASSAGNFERSIFLASYDEFKFKSQAYNREGAYKTFTELKARDGRANSLHYKLSFSVGHFIDTLNNKIPELIDNLGNSIIFDVPQFELIESDITNRDSHKVAINYITPSLTLCQVIGDYLLLAKGMINPNEPAESFMIKMQPNLSIISYQLQSSANTIALSALHRQ